LSKKKTAKTKKKIFLGGAGEKYMHISDLEWEHSIDEYIFENLFALWLFQIHFMQYKSTIDHFQKITVSDMISLLTERF